MMVTAGEFGRPLRRLFVTLQAVAFAWCAAPIAFAGDRQAAPTVPCAGGTAPASGSTLLKAGVSASLLAATQEQKTVSGQFIARRTWNGGSETAPACGWKHQRTLADISVSYDEKTSAAGATTITRNHGALFQHLIFLKSNASFLYLMADLYHNNSLGLDLKQTYGGGIGYARGAFEVGADLRLIHEDFLQPNEDFRLVGVGLSGRYDFSLDDLLTGGDLTLAATIVPVLNQRDAWFANSTLQLFLPFKSGRWGVTVSVQDNYLRNAPIDFKRNYLKSAIGLAYVAK